MQGPTGSSGVQAFPNSGHCAGLRLPVMTSPQRQAVGVSVSEYRMSKRFSASKSFSSSRRPRPLLSIPPRPRQRSKRGSKHCFNILCARMLPFCDTARVYSFSSRGLFSASCLTSRKIARRISSGSKPATTAGRLYSSGRKAKPSAPMIVATWPGQRKPSTLKPSIRISARSAGSTLLSIDQRVKFFAPFSFAVKTAAAVPGAVVSKPTPRKTTCFSGFCSASSTASTGE